MRLNFIDCWTIQFDVVDEIYSLCAIAWFPSAKYKLCSHAGRIAESMSVKYAEAFGCGVMCGVDVGLAWVDFWGEEASVQPCFEAWERSFELGIGRRVAGRSGDEVGGRRKGREPVGEAWLEEGTRMCGRPDMRSAVCHFKHPGL